MRDNVETDALMPLPQFQEELRRLAGFSRSTLPADPLAAILLQIVENPAFSESRLLTRLLTAIAYQRGDFRFAEAAVFHSHTLALIVGLLDMLGSGAVTEAQCRVAVKSADAAQLGIGA